MELSEADKYEIKAETFRIMTGHMAPGKDASPASCQSPLNERIAAYDKWYADNSVCINSMFLAFRRVLSVDE